MENIKNTHNIVYIEAGDHLITDETRRHKLALMITCSFVLMISYYHNAQVSTLFGVIKFSDGDEISVLNLIPFAFLVMLYHAYIYAYHLSQAKKAWVNKIQKALIEGSIATFDKFSSQIEDSRRNNIDNLPDLINLNKNTKITEKLNSLRKLENSLKEGEDRWSNHRFLGQRIHTIRSIITKLNDRELSPSQEEMYQRYSELTPKLIDEIEPIIGDMPFQEWPADRLSILKACTSTLNETIQELDELYLNKYNFYLEENYKRNFNHICLVKNALTQRKEIIDTLEKTAFDDKKATFIYSVIPSIYFILASVMGVYTFVANS